MLHFYGIQIITYYFQQGKMVGHIEEIMLSRCEDLTSLAPQFYGLIPWCGNLLLNPSESQILHPLSRGKDAKTVVGRLHLGGTEQNPETDFPEMFTTLLLRPGGLKSHSMVLPAARKLHARQRSALLKSVSREGGRGCWRRRPSAPAQIALLPE